MRVLSLKQLITVIFEKTIVKKYIFRYSTIISRWLFIFCFSLKVNSFAKYEIWLIGMGIKIV